MNSEPDVEIFDAESNIEFNEKEFDGLGITYDFLDSNGKKWIQSAVAEYMLGVGYKQFDRYCKELNINKQKHKTKRYSHNFIKEEDVEIIAERYSKVLKRPFTDIPLTDDNKKVLSKEDVNGMVGSLVKERANELVVSFQKRISNLEEKNDLLNNDIKKVLVEKSNEIEKKSNWKTGALIFIFLLFFVSGSFFYFYRTWKKQQMEIKIESASLAEKYNSALVEINEKAQTINDYQKQVKDIEIEYLKKQAKENTSFLKYMPVDTPYNSLYDFFSKEGK